MIRLFNSKETDFSHNESVLSEIISCKVTEEINGDYTIELEYPIEDSKNISNNLVTASIISVPTIDSRDNQLFRIIEKETNSNSIVVQGQAKLLADLKTNRIKALTITGKTRKEAIQTVLDSALESHNYLVGNLDSNGNTNIIVSAKEGNLLTAIIGEENSVLDEYGGEFIVDNNTIDIVNQRGQDKGVIIEYGKNLSSIKETIDITDLATVLIPKSGDYRLPEYCIESPNVGLYEKRYFQEVEFNLDIWDGTGEQGENQITEEEANAIMRNTCNKMFINDKVDQITFNYNIDFIELSQTEEYKNYKILETVNMGDTVYIKHKKLNLNLKGRINKISYTVDSEGITTIDKIEIGFTRKNITDIISDTVKSIKFAKEEINLQITNTARNITAAFTIADDTIKQSVTDTKNALQAEIDINSTKINAVVEQDGAGMGWELSKNAFKVACVGSSGASVTIDEYGLTVDDGKFKLKKNGSTKFYVSTSGRCTADGGFVVDDGDTNCKLDSNGLSLTNSDGYVGKLQVYDRSDTLYTPSDFHIDEDLFVAGHTVIDDWCDIGDDLDVGGSKNCLQRTINYGNRRINAYETAEYYFGDIGSGVIQNGECIVFIDDVFSECINTNVEYQVSIFEYSNRGSITEVERYPTHFIVKGNIDNLKFGWELKAKRIGYENNRLEFKPDKENTSTLQSENLLLENNILDITGSLLENESTNLEEILLEEVV